MIQKRPKTEEPDRLPPQDLEAERAVLASILLDNGAFDEVAAQHVTARSFYADAHRKAFSAIAAMYERAPRGIDTLTLADELTKRGHLDDVGGVPYLVRVLESVPHAAHADFYAKIVRAKSLEREMIDACQDGLREVYGPHGEIRDILGRHEQRIFSIVQNECAGADPSIGSILDEAFARLLTRMETPGKISGQPTGFAGLDELISGFNPSELIVLAARPAMGKTALVCNFALAMAQKGCGVLLFSLEQSRLELGERLLCIQSRIDGHKLRKGDLSFVEQDALNSSGHELRPLPIFIDDFAGQSMTRIAAISRRLKRTDNIGIVIIDYLQLIEAEDRSIPREQQIASITRRLKFLAKDLSIPVMALAQLNRAVEAREDKKPRLADLRESGAIEQDADVVMFLHRPDAYDPKDHPGEADLIVAKNRSGPVGTAELVWMKHALRFGDKAKSVVPDEDLE